MGAQSKGSGTSIKGKSALAEFCRDLCEEARCGRIDPVRLVCGLPGAAQCDKCWRQIQAAPWMHWSWMDGSQPLRHSGAWA